jgi:hypothetical protein
MAITAAYESSASIGTTEYSLPNSSTTLTPITVDGVYQVFLDLANMVAGDQYELKLYEKVTSGGSQRLIDTFIFTGAQSKPAFVAPSMIFLHGWDVTLKRLTGSDRTIGWSIRQVA